MPFQFARFNWKQSNITFSFANTADVEKFVSIIPLPSQRMASKAKVKYSFTQRRRNETFNEDTTLKHLPLQKKEIKPG